MAKVMVDISMSLDGFVAGPDDGLGRGARGGRRADPQLGDGRPLDLP
jgi:hypothetical protein